MKRKVNGKSNKQNDIIMKTRQRLIVTLLMAMFMGMQVMAQEKQAYAFLSSDGKTLTFYYDDQKSTRQEGSAYALNTGTNTPKWLDVSYIPITTVVFDSSFKDARPTSTYSWFKEQGSLTTITGIENLNTSEVTNMSYMFHACHGLTSLDLSNFDTSKVTDMSCMFYECDELQHICSNHVKNSLVAVAQSIVKTILLVHTPVSMAAHSNLATCQLYLR